MVIYNQAGDVLLDIPVDDDSYRYRAIAQAKKVELRYSLVEHVELPTGAYIEYQGERYTLWYPSDFKKEGTRNFEYKVTFGGNEEILKKYKYKLLSDKPYKLKFVMTANKILEACINALWDKDVEQKKLNDYNAAQLGILDLSYVESYKTFLNERKALKDRVDSDFAEWEAAREDESVVVL